MALNRTMDRLAAPKEEWRVMDRPLVTVIIPTYNFDRFVMDALASALAQTHQPLEIIVVDDGSTDETPMRLRQVTSDFRYIRTQRRGPAAARNTGLRYARGEYIAFLDADDLWEPGKVARDVDQLERHPAAGLSYCWWAHCDESGRPLPEVGKPTHQGQVIEPLANGCFINPSVTTVRRKCFDLLGGFDPSFKRCEDWEMLLRIAAARYEFCCVPAVLACKRIHDAQMSRDPLEMLPWEERVLESHFSRPDVSRLDRARAYAQLYARVSAQCFARGESSSGAEAFHRAAVFCPELVGRPGFFVGMAKNLLPPGYRTREEIMRRLPFICKNLVAMGSVGSKNTLHSAHLATAALGAFTGRWPRFLEDLWKAFQLDPFRTFALPASAGWHRIAAVRAELAQ